MNKSILDLARVLNDELLAFPAIVDRLEKKDPDFLNYLLAWIKRIEEIFLSYNISEVSLLAGIRSRIIASQYDHSRHSQRKREQLKTAAKSLFDLQSIVLSVLKPYDSKIDEARSLIRQLLGVAEQFELISFKTPDNFQALVEKLWVLFQEHEQLKPGAVKVKTIISETDALRIIAEEVDLLSLMQPLTRGQIT